MGKVMKLMQWCFPLCFLLLLITFFLPESTPAFCTNITCSFCGIVCPALYNTAYEMDEELRKHHLTKGLFKRATIASFWEHVLYRNTTRKDMCIVMIYVEIMAFFLFWFCIGVCGIFLFDWLVKEALTLAQWEILLQRFLFVAFFAFVLGPAFLVFLVKQKVSKHIRKGNSD